MVLPRVERKRRLQDAGKWQEFLAYRDGLRAQGHSERESDLLATDAFAEYLSDSYESPGEEEFDESPGDVIPAVPRPAKPVIQGLSLAQFAGKKKVGNREIVEWVFDHIDVMDVTPEMAPSSGAWSFLQRLRESSELLREFYKVVWAKLLPNRAQLEMSERFKDDGRRQFELIDRIRAAIGDPVLSPGAEGVEGEFEIPGVDDPAGAVEQ